MEDFLGYWVKNVSDNRGHSYGQANADYILSLPKSQQQRAVRILVENNWPEYTGDSFYPDLAFTILDGFSSQQSVKDYLDTVPVEDRLN
mmetsp:Transcript_11109/g.18640  ORF Transcript_11109/g.18640 Transcript_11109/m.18640 type:complete len:89 (-) Transcript_11109:851-1117(-)